MNAPAPSVNDVIDALADALAQRVADRLALREPEHASPRGTEPAYLSEQEAARRTRLSRRTLQGWRARGEGPRYVKLGRAVRYPIRDLEEFVAGERRSSEPRRAQRHRRERSRTV